MPETLTHEVVTVLAHDDEQLRVRLSAELEVEPWHPATCPLRTERRWLAEGAEAWLEEVAVVLSCDHGGTEVLEQTTELARIHRASSGRYTLLRPRPGGGWSTDHQLSRQQVPPKVVSALGRWRRPASVLVLHPHFAAADDHLPDDPVLMAAYEASTSLGDLLAALWGDDQRKDLTRACARASLDELSLARCLHRPGQTPVEWLVPFLDRLREARTGPERNHPLRAGGLLETHLQALDARSVRLLLRRPPVSCSARSAVSDLAGLPVASVQPVVAKSWEDLRTRAARAWAADQVAAAVEQSRLAEEQAGAQEQWLASEAGQAWLAERQARERAALAAQEAERAAAEAKEAEGREERERRAAPLIEAVAAIPCWTVERIMDQEVLDRLHEERKLCIDTDPYPQRMRTATSLLLSVRNPLGELAGAVEVDLTKEIPVIVQVRGHHNRELACRGLIVDALAAAGADPSHCNR